ncbi:MAG: hypothetical protein ACRDRT_14395 [Pseudonocardiaceae bacterium]
MGGTRTYAKLAREVGRTTTALRDLSYGPGDIFALCTTRPFDIAARPP